MGRSNEGWIANNRLLEPARPANVTPARPPAQVLASILVNLEWALDAASLKLNRLKPGSSSYKTQGGLVRGLREALELVKAEGGQS